MTRNLAHLFCLEKSVKELLHIEELTLETEENIDEKSTEFSSLTDKQLGKLVASSPKLLKPA